MPEEIREQAPKDDPYDGTYNNSDSKRCYHFGDLSRCVTACRTCLAVDGDLIFLVLVSVCRKINRCQEISEFHIVISRGGISNYYMKLKRIFLI